MFKPHQEYVVLCLVAQSCPTLCDPMDPTRLLCSWGFFRQEYLGGLPCPPPGDLPNPGIEPRSPALQMDSLPSELPGKHKSIREYKYSAWKKFRGWIFPMFNSLRGCQLKETRHDVCCLKVGISSNKQRPSVYWVLPYIEWRKNSTAAQSWKYGIVRKEFPSIRDTSADAVRQLRGVWGRRLWNWLSHGK